MQASGDTNTPREYTFQGFRLDVSRHSLIGPDGDVRPLSSRALDTLLLLVKHRGELLSKATLLEQVWPGAFVEENNLNQAITSIRRALGDSKHESRFIKTLTGKGYCFIAELDDPAMSVPATVPAPQSGPDNSHPRGFLLPVSNFGMAFLLVLAGIVVTSLSFYAFRDAPAMSAVSADAPANPARVANAAPGHSVMPGSIAVLPLSNLSPDPDQDNSLFALGLHDELINQLSRINNLQLVSRESVLAPTLQNLPPSEVGRLLRVEYLVSGTILFIDEIARIKLQMLDPETGVIKWSFDYDLTTDNLDDMFQAQNDIAGRVSEALQANLGLLTVPAILASPTESFEAYRYNLASRRAYYNQDFRKSLTLSERALELDPDYPGALYNYSKAHYYLSSTPLEGMTTADHIRLGLESAQRLIDLSPNKHEGYVLKATALSTSGRWEDAMEEVGRIRSMNAPLWDQQLLVPLLMSLGEYQSTIDILEANLQVEPLNSYGRGFLVAAYEVMGKRVQARQEYDMGEELTPVWWGDVVDFFLTLGRDEVFPDLDGIQGTTEEVKSLLARIYAGDRNTVIDYLNEALYGETEATGHFVHFAALAALLDEDGLAIQFMDRATATLPVHLHWIWMPVFQDTWTHPDFPALLARTGVLAYWQKYGAPEFCQTGSVPPVCANLALEN